MARRHIIPVVVLLVTAWTLGVASAPQDPLVRLRRPDAPGDQEAPASYRITRYFGGSRSDTSHAVAVDSQRHTYVAGFTTSPELLAALPVPPGTTLPFPLGTSFPYLAKFDSRGQLMYLHGLPPYAPLSVDVGKISLAIDVADNVYATGRYARTGREGYLVKFDASGNQVFVRTFAAAEIGFAVPSGLAVGASGEIVLVGGDAYVLKLSPQGDVMWRQHLGAGTGSTAHAVDLDAAGSIYVGGVTNVATFPTTHGSVQPQIAPGRCVDPSSSSRNLRFILCADAFVAKLTPLGSIEYASFFGGSRIDGATAIAVDDTGAATIAGYTESFDLPTVNAAQPACAGTSLSCTDLFVAKVDPAGSRLVYATYYGGTLGVVESATAVEVDALGNSYVVGSTSAKDWPTVNAPQSHAGGGPVFASRDRGASWTFSSDGLKTNVITNIVWPRPDTVYARGDRGVFRSTDGGATWRALAIDGVGPVYNVVVDPANPSILYGSSVSAGLYKSLDGGQAWTRLTLPNECRGGLVVSPAQPAVLYLGGVSVCRSDDGGSTWRTMFTATPDILHVSPLAADPRDTGTVYGVATEKYYQTRIYKTLDGGRTWNPIGALPRLGRGIAPQFAPTKLLVDAVNPQIIYTAVGGGVVRSRDGGATWTSISDGLPESRESPLSGAIATYDIAQDPLRPQTLYAAGTDDAVYRSDDRGEHWQRVNGAFPNVRLVAANGGRVLVSTISGSDGFLVAFDPYGAVITSTYVGGSGTDTLSGIKVIGLDGLVIGGTTSSPYWPLAAGAERDYRGGSDAFWMQILRAPSR